MCPNWYFYWILKLEHHYFPVVLYEKKTFFVFVEFLYAVSVILLWLVRNEDVCYTFVEHCERKFFCCTSASNDTFFFVIVVLEDWLPWLKQLNYYKPDSFVSKHMECMAFLSGFILREVGFGFINCFEYCS